MAYTIWHSGSYYLHSKIHIYVVLWLESLVYSTLFSPLSLSIIDRVSDNVLEWKHWYWHVENWVSETIGLGFWNIIGILEHYLPTLIPVWMNVQYADGEGKNEGQTTFLLCIWMKMHMYKIMYIWNAYSLHGNFKILIRKLYVAHIRWQNTFGVNKWVEWVGHMTYAIVRKLNASYCNIQRSQEWIEFFLATFMIAL